MLRERASEPCGLQRRGARLTEALNFNLSIMLYTIVLATFLAPAGRIADSVVDRPGTGVRVACIPAAAAAGRLRGRDGVGQLVAEHVVVLGPPAALAPLAGQLDQRVALPAFDPVQLAQVGNGVAVRLDPFSLFYVIKLTCTPVELELIVGL